MFDFKHQVAEKKPWESHDIKINGIMIFRKGTVSANLNSGGADRLIVTQDVSKIDEYGIATFLK